ncbi:MAG: hypothetical protein JRM85_05035 [Nitrososphaerota archaeon]|nr:hypothetical protein [Nitrososphaerota archaeon]
MTQLSREGREKVIKTTRATVALRRKLMEESIPFLERCANDAPIGTCIVCGEPNPFSLDKHHPYGREVDSKTVVLLCASCHRIFDKGGSLDMLKERRDRLLDMNRAFVP